MLHANDYFNADGSCQRWRINGQTKTWKTKPEKFRIPIKHGLRDYSYYTDENQSLFHKEEDCPNAK